MAKHQKLLILFISAFILKLLLFAFVEWHAPDAKIQIDSADYLICAQNLVEHRYFARDVTEGPEVFRTPGYPVFLGLFHKLFHIPLSGIIFLQILLNFLTAYIVYRTAIQIDERLGYLSALIILFDPPITVFSMMILTESLFLLLIALFMFIFVLFLKKERLTILVASAIPLVAAIYVRPIGFFLGAAASIFVIYAMARKDLKKISLALIYAGVFFLVVYSLQGLWVQRNIRLARQAVFTNISDWTFRREGLFHSYTRIRLDEPSLQTTQPLKAMGPAPYYAHVTSKSLMKLMTRPGTFKYFESRPLKAAGKIFGYPWMVFWLTGLLVGVAKMRGNIYYHFLAFVVLYFIGTSVGGAFLNVSPRFRIPMMPFLAVLCAYGWTVLSAKFPRKQN